MTKKPLTSLLIVTHHKQQVLISKPQSRSPQEAVSPPAQLISSVYGPVTPVQTDRATVETSRCLLTEKPCGKNTVGCIH